MARATGAVAEAKAKGFDTVIVDTAGRLHIDDDLMNELQGIKNAVQPSDLLYVADAMTGQDAIKSAGEFNRRIGVTGVVLTKLDGDARGGAALSVRHVTGKPIKFAGVGEKLNGLEPFHPERMASRILGMGDVLTLIEKAEAAVEADEQALLEQRMLAGEFTFDDFLSSVKMLRRMGPLQGVLKMIPGLGKQLQGLDVDERQMGRVEAIVLSMTPAERRNPKILNGSRRKRIARGSGTTVQEVNQLLKQFAEMNKMMKQIQSTFGTKLLRR